MLTVLLKVEEEQVKQTASSGTGRLQLAGNEIFIGGVPSRVNTTRLVSVACCTVYVTIAFVSVYACQNLFCFAVFRYGVTSTPFLGCMKTVQLGSGSITQQNFFDGLFAGISAGCNSQVCFAYSTASY